MPVHIVCPSCGFENKTAGVFCGRCGSRMGVGGAPTLNEVRDPMRFVRGAMTTLKRLVQLGLAVVIGLLLWPIRPPEIEADAVRGRDLHALLDRFSEAGTRQGSAVHVFPEEALNNYLAWRTEEGLAEMGGTGYRMSIRQVHIRLRALPALSEVNVVAGLGPLRFSHVLEGQFVAGPGQPFRMAVKRSRLGHMPMPTPLHGWMAEKVEGAMGGLDRDRAVLDRAVRIDVDDGRARVTIGP
jgi:hypothetical protein